MSTRPWPPRKALRPWQRLGAAERGKYIYRIARTLQERSREFAAIESLDGSKPIRSRGISISVSGGALLSLRRMGGQARCAFPGRRAVPLGVAEQIIPWNFPLLMAAWKIAPALACAIPLFSANRANC